MKRAVLFLFLFVTVALTSFSVNIPVFAKSVSTTHTPGVVKISIPSTSSGTFTTYLPVPRCTKSPTQTCLVKAKLTVSKPFPVIKDANGVYHAEKSNYAGKVLPNDTPCQTLGRSYDQQMGDSNTNNQAWYTDHQGTFIYNSCNPPVTVNGQTCWRHNHSGDPYGIQYSLSVTNCSWYNIQGGAQAHAEEDFQVTSSDGSGGQTTDSYYQYIVADYFGNIVNEYQSPH